MKLTKKGEYALRAMIALAQHEGSRVTILKIAEEQQIPKKFLEQILLALKASGLVVSQAGPKGGYRLSKPPLAITAGAMLQAVSEPISRPSPRKTKHRGNPSRVESLLEDVRQFVRAKFEAVTLQELAADSFRREQVEALMWYI